jgi:hypothetical protein
MTGAAPRPLHALAGHDWRTATTAACFLAPHLLPALVTGPAHATAPRGAPSSVVGHRPAFAGRKPHLLLCPCAARSAAALAAQPRMTHPALAHCMCRAAPVVKGCRLHLRPPPIMSSLHMQKPRPAPAAHDWHAHAATTAAHAPTGTGRLAPRLAAFPMTSPRLGGRGNQPRTQSPGPAGRRHRAAPRLLGAPARTPPRAL